MLLHTANSVRYRTGHLAHTKVYCNCLHYVGEHKQTKSAERQKWKLALGVEQHSLSTLQLAKQILNNWFNLLMFSKHIIT